MREWLRWTFTLVPIAAGADKFLNLLTDWKQYAAPLGGMLPFDTATLMMIVGVIEIAAGVLVFKFTKIGAGIVAAWLVLIALTLVMGGWYDIAVRDIVMAIAALCLYRLAR